MRILIAIILAVLGSFFLGLTIDNSIISNIVVKILAILCLVGAFKLPNKIAR